VESSSPSTSTLPLRHQKPSKNSFNPSNSIEDSSVGAARRAGWLAHFFPGPCTARALATFFFGTSRYQFRSKNPYQLLGQQGSLLIELAAPSCTPASATGQGRPAVLPRSGYGMPLSILCEGKGPESAGFVQDAALSAPCGFGAITAFL
jgi:hypothetical protein